MGTFLLTFAIAVVAGAVFVSRYLERRKSERALDLQEPEVLMSDEVIELDDRDIVAVLPPPVPTRAVRQLAA